MATGITIYKTHFYVFGAMGFCRIFIQVMLLNLKLRIYYFLSKICSCKNEMQLWLVKF